MKPSDQIKQIMKRSIYLNLLTVALLLCAGTVGCRPKPKNPTPIPTGKTGVQPESGPFGPETVRPLPPTTDVTSAPPRDPNAAIPPAERWNRDNFIPDREALAANTVYFDFDRHTVKASEQSKIEAVAGHLRSNQGDAVEVEGHCDERGTEAYNLSLGERRALAIREYLVNLGIDSQRVHTISYGETHPVDLGHKESAWKKNRRGVFILLKPKQ
jgi:peptidoglycan-associated lipoprotein